MIVNIPWRIFLSSNIAFDTFSQICWDSYASEKKGGEYLSK